MMRLLRCAAARARLHLGEFRLVVPLTLILAHFGLFPFWYGHFLSLLTSLHSVRVVCATQPHSFQRIQRRPAIVFTIFTAFTRRHIQICPTRHA